MAMPFQLSCTFPFASRSSIDVCTMGIAARQSPSPAKARATSLGQIVAPGCHLARSASTNARAASPLNYDQLALKPAPLSSDRASAVASSATAVPFCWLVPSPIAPGLGRSSPETSAAAASSRVAPPRMRLIMSRIRFVSSQSCASAAAFICRIRLSIVSVIMGQRKGGRLASFWSRPGSSETSRLAGATGLLSCGDPSRTFSVDFSVLRCRRSAFHSAIPASPSLTAYAMAYAEESE